MGFWLLQGPTHAFRNELCYCRCPNIHEIYKIDAGLEAHLLTLLDGADNAITPAGILKKLEMREGQKFVIATRDFSSEDSSSRRKLRRAETLTLEIIE